MRIVIDLPIRPLQTKRKFPGSAFLYAQGRAQVLVSKARALGMLPNLKEADIRCSDNCGRLAREWDHEDYDHPNIVEAVCRNCNRRRGSAAVRAKLGRALEKGPK